ncbi:MAG TPA: hypothetical protein VIG74_02410 [Alphaproteobacteria bacterium]|jgi:hypothetical protein
MTHDEKIALAIAKGAAGLFFWGGFVWLWLSAGWQVACAVLLIILGAILQASSKIYERKPRTEK